MNSIFYIFPLGLPIKEISAYRRSTGFRFSENGNLQKITENLFDSLSQSMRILCLGTPQRKSPFRGFFFAGWQWVRHYNCSSGPRVSAVSARKTNANQRNAVSWPPKSWV